MTYSLFILTYKYLPVFFWNKRRQLGFFQPKNSPMFGSGNSCLAMKAMAGILQRWRRKSRALEFHTSIRRSLVVDPSARWWIRWISGETPRFEPSEEVIGITDPLGYFDPLGFCKQGDFEGFLGERLGKVVEWFGVFWSWFLRITEVSIQKSSWVEAWTSCHAGCLDVPFLCLWIPLGWGKNGKMLVGHESFGYPLHW